MSKQLKETMELLHKGGAVPLNVVEAVNELLEQAEEHGTLIEQQGKEMIRLQQLANKQGKELEEARKIRFPRQPGGKYGWTIAFDFLAMIQQAMDDGPFSFTSEEIEAVLLTLESVGQEGEGDQ